jgi:hypothetical protein
LLYSLYNKIRDKGKTVSAWKGGGGGRGRGQEERGGREGRGREMTQILYAHMNKRY